MTLDQLKPGQVAIVTDVVGDDGISMRLMEMGLIDGVEVRLVGTAPFGDPMEFELRGYHLSLRSTEARRVQIRLAGSQEAGSA